jgi:hypothetical protein
VAISVTLIAFGAVVAILPHHHDAEPPSMSLARGTAGDRLSKLPAQELVAQETAAQQVAVRFVTACDTTTPAQPHGDVATQAALAPALAVPHDMVEPAAWGTVDRATTVALDAPGQTVAERGDTVAVIVTGTMTVTSDSGPTQLVPLAERVSLRPLNEDDSARDHSAGDRGASGWRVVGVEVGA